MSYAYFCTWCGRFGRARVKVYRIGYEPPPGWVEAKRHDWSSKVHFCSDYCLKMYEVHHDMENDDEDNDKEEWVELIAYSA